MITLNDYIPDHKLVFADGGLPEVMQWLQSTSPKFSSGGPRDPRPDDFNGYSTWDDIVKYASDGWSEGAERINRLMATPLPFPMERALPHWTADVAGAYPDIGRYLGGDPRHMRRRKVEKGRHPYIVLYIGMGVRANVSTESFTNFGTAVCQIVDAIEHRGTRVELNQLTRAHVGSRYLVTGWRVKEASQPLDMAAVAFTYMHPGAHRRLQFQMRARIGSDVGGSTTVDTIHFPDAPENALIFAGISEHAASCKTLQGAREFLRNRINIAAGEELVTKEMLSNLE